MGRAITPIDDSPILVHRPPTPALRQILELASLFARNEGDTCTRLKHLESALEMAGDIKTAAKERQRAHRPPARLPALVKRPPVPLTPLDPPGFACPHCGARNDRYIAHKSHVKHCPKGGRRG